MYYRIKDVITNEKYKDEVAGDTKLHDNKIKWRAPDRLSHLLVAYNASDM